MRSVLLLLLVMLSAAPLWGQPPLPPDDPPPPANGGQAPAPGLTLDEVMRLIDERQRGMEQYIEDEIDQAVRRRFTDFSPIRSRRELFVELSGGLTVKYRQAQSKFESGQVSGGRRAPTGIGLTRAWLSVHAGYSDIVSSELTFAYNGDYSLLDEDMFEIPRGIIVYNRPFSQFLPPGFFADSFLFGIEGHFWRQHRASESMALGQRAFHQDEVAQIRYTARFLNNLYLIGALSDGTLLGRGQVDDSNNYPLLQDDKTRYIRGLGDTGEVSHYLQLEFGGGFIFDFNATSFLASNAPFDPGRWTGQNTNYLNILAWGSIDRLSRNETALIEGMHRNPYHGGTPDAPGRRIRRAKWRMGANIDFGIRIAGGDLFVQAHGIHAEDGRFVRDAWGVEARYTIELPGIPFFLRVTPMFRYSELITNNRDNPLDETDPFGGPLRVSSGAVPGFSLADAAGFAANRREYMIGVNLTMARNVTLGFEIIFNEEDFKQRRSIARDIPNTFYMLRIAAEF